MTMISKNDRHRSKMIDGVVSVSDELNEAKGHVGEMVDKEQSNAWWM